MEGQGRAGGGLKTRPAVASQGLAATAGGCYAAGMRFRTLPCLLLLAACNINPPSLRGTWREAQESLPGIAEAETLLTGAGFDRRAREDQALHAAADELCHRLRDGEIGLASACRPECKDHVVTHQRAHVFDLRGRARDDGFLAGADHDRRRTVRGTGDDPFQRRLVRHHDQRFDRAGIDFVP